MGEPLRLLGGTSGGVVVGWNILPAVPFIKTPHSTGGRRNKKPYKQE